VRISVQPITDSGRSRSEPITDSGRDGSPPVGVERRGTTPPAVRSVRRVGLDHRRRDCMLADQHWARTRPRLLPARPEADPRPCGARGRRKQPWCDVANLPSRVTLPPGAREVTLSAQYVRRTSCRAYTVPASSFCRPCGLMDAVGVRRLPSRRPENVQSFSSRDAHMILLTLVGVRS